MERKTFIKTSLMFCGAGLMGSAFLESCAKATPTPTIPPFTSFTINITDPANSSLNNVGGFIEHQNVIIIRTGTTTYSALSNVCTHRGCTVEYDVTTTSVFCPCHGGTFDVNGNVTGGPPPSALIKHTATLNGNILTIS